jgi:hypothetical protein
VHSPSYDDASCLLLMVRHACCSLPPNLLHSAAALGCTVHWCSFICGAARKPRVDPDKQSASCPNVAGP